jgi:transcription elongation factor GreA
MAGKKIHLTKKGYRKLLDRKERLERELAEAREITGPAAQSEPGNVWHDNAAFEQAEREVDKLASMLREVNRLLSSAVVVKPEDVPEGKVGIGSRIKVRMGNEIQSYLVTGWGEAEGEEDRVSYSSPMGRALLGRRVGNKVKVKAPGGKVSMEILEIIPPSAA